MAFLTIHLARLAIFIDGCFWHGCPRHATHPATNSEWWRRKLEGNIARDLRTNRAMAAAGWRVLRFWEHTPVADIVDVVMKELAADR
jgi:DNA mismatch endonuclease, patch repair protein